MACFKPITAWYSKLLNASGKRSLVFASNLALQPDDPIEIACGQCAGCRLDRSKTWAVRCMHEAQMHEDNCFITLTFDEEHLWKRENPGSICNKEHQKFLKRYRKYLGKGRKIKYYMAGEYGDENNRPHYHYCIFGHDFDDKIFYKETHDQNRLYISPDLNRLWPFGMAILGDVTFESAAYVARYCMKKINGQLADQHYVWTDERTGEIREREPEFNRMSLKPPIGAEWIDKYIDDVYQGDFVVLSNGQKVKPPKFYDGILEKKRPYEFDAIKEKRYIYGTDPRVQENRTKKRLADRLKVLERKLERLPRKDG